jgi:phosphoserine phosphatase
MDKTRIYVVRHAQSGFNAGMDIREYDSHLTELGIEQAKERAEEFKDIEFAGYYTSTLHRTIETADIIKGESNLSIHTDPTTVERSIYLYAQKLGTEVADLEEILVNEMKDMSDEEKMNYMHSPQMETAKEGAKRLLAQIKETVKEHKGKNILIVSHGNLMRSLLTYLGFAKYDDLPVGSIENTGYFILETADGENFEVIKTYKVNVQPGKQRYW